jgi:hypothetical protein
LKNFDIFIGNYPGYLKTAFPLCCIVTSYKGHDITTLYTGQKLVCPEVEGSIFL